MRSQKGIREMSVVFAAPSRGSAGHQLRLFEVSNVKHIQFSAVFLGLTLFGVARGEDKTWTGAVNNVWNTTTANWSGTTNTWSNTGDAAVFTSTGAGTISVNGFLHVRSFNFTSGSNYAFNSTSPVNPSRFNMNGNPSGTFDPGRFHVEASGVVDMNVQIDTTVGLHKTGGGTLRFGPTPFGFPTLSGTGNIRIGDFGHAQPIGAAGTIELAPNAFFEMQQLAIGAGWLHLNSSIPMTVSGLSFSNTVESGTYGPNGNNGVYGSGTLRVLDRIVTSPNQEGRSNSIRTNLAMQGTGLTFEMNASSFTPEYTALHVTGSISGSQSQALIKKGPPTVFSASVTGGLGLYGNNSYTGPTQIFGGAGGDFTTEPRGNVVAGTNASTSLEVYGGHLTLFGANGSFGSASTVFVGKGVLSLDNVSTTNGMNAPAVPAANNNNRLHNDALVALQGGSLHLIGQTGAASNQTISSLLTGPGANFVRVTATAGGTASLTATEWLQSPTKDDVTRFQGTELGGPTKIKIIGNVPVHVGGLIPRAVGFNESSNEWGFVKHDSTNGIMLLSPQDYTPNFGAGGNVSLAVNPPPVATQTVNAIRTTGAAPVGVVFDPSATLSLTSGTVSTVPPTTFGTQGVNSTITAGSEPLTFITIADTTVHSQITGTGGILHGGEGTLELHGSLNGLIGDLVNTKGRTKLYRDYTQPIKLLAGKVHFEADQSGQAVDVGDPTLPPDQDAKARTIKTRQSADSTITKAIRMYDAGEIETPPDTTATFLGEFTGSGNWKKVGPGKMVKAGNSQNFTGAVTVAQGTLTIEGSLNCLQMTVEAGALAQGTGTVTPQLSVQFVEASIAKGGASPGTLTIAGNVNFATSPLGGAILRAEGDGIQNSKIVVAGATKTFNLEGLTGSNKFTIDIVGPSLSVGTNYSWELVRTMDNAAGLLVDGMVGTGGVIPASNYVLTSADFPSFTNVSLIANGNSLILNFTPVPEPLGLLAIAASAGGLWRLRKRRASRAELDGQSVRSQI